MIELLEKRSWRQRRINKIKFWRCRDAAPRSAQSKYYVFVNKGQRSHLHVRFFLSARHDASCEGCAGVCREVALALCTQYARTRENKISLERTFREKWRGMWLNAGSADSGMRSVAVPLYSPPKQVPIAYFSVCVHCVYPHTLVHTSHSPTSTQW